MLKRKVTYEDYNGNEQTETFYFNLSKAEIVELEVEYKGGLSEAIQNIIRAEDSKAMIAEFKRIVLLAYGEKTDDGKRFIKNDQLREAFEQSAAYSALFMELALDSKAAADFINGIVPKDLAEMMEKEDLKTKTAAVIGTTSMVGTTAEIAAAQANTGE